MFNRNLFSLSMLLFCSINFIQAQNNTADELLEQLISEHNIIGVSAGYSIDGETIWQNAAGFSDKENEIPFALNTKTRLASIAKPMTAIAIMQLVEKELLDLEEPIQTYIPNFPKKSSNDITVKHLLSHTSGIGGYASGKEAQNETEYPTLSDAMAIFQDRDLEFEPGTDFAYTSYGYVVLGVIIENVSGLDYETYMQQNIWNPAGMENTGIEKAGETYENKSSLYHANRKKAKLASANNLSNRTPAGGFYSTINDMLAFGNAVLNNTLITSESFAKMTEVSFAHEKGNLYGYGWSLFGVPPNEGEVIGHSGGQTGANTFMFMQPEIKSVIVVLANTSGTGNQVATTAVSLLHQVNDLVKGEE